MSDRRERELERRWRETGTPEAELALLAVQQRRGLSLTLAAHLGHGPARELLGLPRNRAATSWDELREWALKLEEWGRPALLRALAGWIRLGLSEVGLTDPWFGGKALIWAETWLGSPTDEHLQAASAELPALQRSRRIYDNNSRQDVYAGDVWVSDKRLRAVAGLCGVAAIDLLRLVCGDPRSPRLPKLLDDAWNALALARHTELFDTRANRSTRGYRSLPGTPRRALLRALRRDAKARLLPWTLERGDPLLEATKVRTYRITESYAAGERIFHPTFGEGEVVVVRGRRVEINFAEGSRILACARKP